MTCCYQRQFSLDMRQNNKFTRHIRENTTSHKIARNEKIALGAAEKVDKYSISRNFARYLAAYDMFSRTCNPMIALPLRCTVAEIISLV